jgi:hypothetical protein
VRDPIRPAGTAVAVAILTLGLAPSAGAVSTSADQTTVATAPSSADAAARYWKCRWPSYRNAHPWRCHQLRFHDDGDHRHDDDGDNRHDGGGDGHGGGRDHDGSRGNDHHGPGWTGAVTGHPGPPRHR